MPHWISSRIEQEPVRVAERPQRPQVRRGGSTRMPPSPWIGSISTAAVSGPIAFSTAARSPNGTWSKPGTIGPKPLTIFSDPAAEIAAVAAAVERRPRRR